MKHVYIIILGLAICSFNLIQAQVGINTNKPLGRFYVDGLGDESINQGNDDLMVDNQGRVSIGEPPLISYNDAKLRIKESITINDGFQKDGYVLTVTTPQYAGWAPLTMKAFQVPLTTAGVSFSYDLWNEYYHTGNSILLDPGYYSVNVIMVYRFASGIRIGENDFLAVRATFSTSPASNPQPTSHLRGVDNIVSTFSESCQYGLMQGSLFIENNTSSAQRYWFIGGKTSFRNDGGSLTGQVIHEFGGTTYGENIITVYQLKTY